VIYNRPAIRLVDVLPRPRRNIVAHNLQRIGLLLPEKGGQQRPDDGLHAAAQNHDGDVVLTRPEKKLLEALIERDVLEQSLYALVEGGVDAVQHFLEGVSKVTASVENILELSEAIFLTIAKVVGDEVIAIFSGDGTVKICEEDELGVGLERRKRRGR